MYRKLISLLSVRAFSYILKRLHQDWRTMCYLLRKRRFRKARSYLWTKLVVRDVGGGARDFVYRRLTRLAPFPREIEIEITTRCHLQCIICEHTHWKDPNYKRLDIGYADFVRICDQFPNLRFVGLNGEGTLFLHRDAEEILEYLTRRGVYIDFAENFDLFGPERIQRLAPLDIERLEVSLDAACAATYETIKVGASWERTLANLRAMREYKLSHRTPCPQIFFRYVVTSLNLKEIPEAVELIADLDMNPGYSTDIEFCGLLCFEEIKHLDVDQIPLDIVHEAEKRALRRRNLRLVWSHSRAKARPLTPIHLCSKWLQPYIMIDGSVVMDCAVMMSNQRDFLKGQSFGNVLSQSFRGIWDSPRYQQARQSVNRRTGPVHVFCKDCRAVDPSSRQKTYGVFGQVPDQVQR